MREYAADMGGAGIRGQGRLLERDLAELARRIESARARLESASDPLRRRTAELDMHELQDRENALRAAIRDYNAHATRLGIDRVRLPHEPI